ncbi:MAG: DUF3592 domain-containing protein [Prevotellaceae bacterium]|jgi:hypothetical protein|nr:DUF3592 domain-containing protein [Prevotellaceae bacterium]
MTETKLALIILCAIEILIIILFCYVIVKIYQAKYWTKHEGLIISSDIEKNITDDNDRMVTTFKNNIFYKYSVNSIYYTSHRIFFGDFIWQSSYLISRKIKNKYNVNNKIVMYYNPKKPQESVLYRGIHIIVLLVFLSNFIVLGMIIIFYKLEQNIL